MPTPVAPPPMTAMSNGSSREVIVRTAWARSMESAPRSDASGQGDVGLDLGTFFPIAGAIQCLGPAAHAVLSEVARHGGLEHAIDLPVGLDVLDAAPEAGGQPCEVGGA